MRKICVVTGSRAEYGLLQWVLRGIEDDPELKLQVIATGAHLSPEFGLTYHEIEGDGFNIDRKVEMLLSSDTAVGVGKSLGLATIGFADALCELAPDLVVVLGDRFEILAAVTAALVGRIPVAHLHGGEATEGAVDDAIRHAITKMAHLHFVAAEEYRQRVIQMGENPDRVFTVGGLGVENIKRLNLLSRVELEQSLNFKFLERNIVVTFHPATLDAAPAGAQMEELLAALERLKDTGIIFTMPNADTDGRILFSMIEEFVRGHPSARAYKSLGQTRYLSCIRFVDGVVGNSSSGLLEVPSLQKGTVNIGSRQNGRLRAGSVIDCAPRRADIEKAIKTMLSGEFRRRLAGTRNPYGDGCASDQVVNVIRTFPLEGLVKKSFYRIGVA